jgi:hypothetical protein
MIKHILQGAQMTEKDLATNVSDYLQRQYPKIMFQFDIGADVKLTIGQATRRKRLQGKWSKGNPDIFIQASRQGCGGLYLELKVVTPYKRNGDLKKSEHLEAQSEYHKKLRKEKFYADFFTGFDEVKSILDWYLK